MTSAIAVHDLSRRYRGHLVLDRVTLEIHGPGIVGLLGRNGAGKTTLMRILAAHDYPTSGSVSVLGQPVWEHGAVLRRMVFVREDQEYPDVKVRDVIRAAERFHPNWSAARADEMADAFELPSNRQIKKLSRGMRSALGVVIGIAARAEVTLLDEPYAGLDAVSRRLFYDFVLEDCIEHPRTVVLSTHLIDEAAGLLEDVVLMAGGGIVLHAPSDDVRGGATVVTGTQRDVERFVADRPTWDRRVLGPRQSVVVAGLLDDVDVTRAREMHLDLRSLSLQEIVVHRAGSGARPTGGSTNGDGATREDLHA